MRFCPEKLRENPHPAQAVAPAHDEPGLPFVLLVGDSISAGYETAVRNRLRGRADVHRIPGNGKSTAHGLKHLSEWLGETPWALVHFNFGLHDLKRVRDKKGQWGPPATSLTQYEDNLEKIVALLKAAGAELIWASTTPVPDGAGNRLRGDEIEYNAFAERVMRKNGIESNDLYTLVLPHLRHFQRSENVHFKETGSEFLGLEVARKIADKLSLKVE